MTGDRNVVSPRMLRNNERIWIAAAEKESAFIWKIQPANDQFVIGLSVNCHLLRTRTKTIRITEAPSIIRVGNRLVRFSILIDVLHPCRIVGNGQGSKISRTGNADSAAQSCQHR